MAEKEEHKQQDLGLANRDKTGDNVVAQPPLNGRASLLT